MNAIVLDLETIPDLTVWSPAEQGPPPDPDRCTKCGDACTPLDHQVRKCPKMARGKCRRPDEAEMRAPKDEFPPPYAHQVIVLGFCVFIDGVPTSLQAWATADQEPALLGSFAQAMSSFGDVPQIVTWNGLGFDLPVIELRSLRHGVQQKWYDGAYRNRFGEGPNVDLQRIFGGSRGADSYMKLDTAAKLIGLPGKNGIDGSMIKALVGAGQWETAKAYCLSDVVQTAYLYLRYRLLRGYIDKQAYQSACEMLEKLYIDNPHFGDFVVDKGRLLP